MNTYQDIVRAYDALLQSGALPLFHSKTELPERSVFSPKEGAPRVALFSPHPDDECIIGALPLRLMRESGFVVRNIAMTLGSNIARQAERWQELRLACGYLGFEVLLSSEGGLGALTEQTKAENGHLWHTYVSTIAEHIIAFQPEIVILPHSHDAHPTHRGTHAVVMDALKVTQYPCWVVQSEFWQPIVQPNVMIACGNHDIADLMTALACHAGEVSRNPYHLRLPAWMADNVRRGAEIIAGNGLRAPNYSFATLYRIDKWDGERLLTYPHAHFLAVDQKASSLFEGE